ncbi:MAG: bifunctional phosphopantothenoylcysteine decarboxylase/phosphopantothenate--cysteine ligase CoaBC [Burkholderiales bacterium]|nr:bifunctional phosphopantothenoylcysteine decarboxylase/phosphopantothenate--cysteine ligase CoaBC [Burkholderiales bacterium]
MTEHRQKRIVLGLTGGIAAFKACELARRLQQQGVAVQAVMTEAATRFVGAATMQALTGRPVFTDLWDPSIENGMAHIDLSRGADMIVIAPATADFLGKLAHGLADDLLSTLCLARECPLVVAPAMNRQMWENPATQRNVALLRADGVTVLGPDSGSQACGESGMGRMLEADTLADELLGLFEPKWLAGLHVVVTAGPTFEKIDAVRGITNRSSGRMGYAIARIARDFGARVTLVSGPTGLEPPPGIAVESVRSAADMLSAVEKHVANCHIFVGVAAVADYTPLNPQDQKMKKDARILSVELAPTVDILANVASRADPPFCIGFAAESENLDEYAEAKRRRKHLPLLAANLAQDAIGSEESELVLFDDSGRHPLPRAPKLEQARRLMEHAARLYAATNGQRGATP